MVPHLNRHYIPDRWRLCESVLKSDGLSPRSFGPKSLVLLCCPDSDSTITRAQVIEGIAHSKSCKIQHGVNDVRRHGNVGGQQIGMTQSRILLWVLGSDLSILLDQTYQADRKEQ